jgi:hypothetical protein
MTTKPINLPLFRDHTVEWLVKHTSFSEQTLIRLKYGYRPMSPKFRRTCAKCLHKSEAELFGEVTL